MSSTPQYPNDEPKPLGAFVRNVHPCGRYHDLGVVTIPDCGYSSITVATGTGSTCYGPARNWAPTDRRPEWLERATPDFLAALARARGEAVA